MRFTDDSLWVHGTQYDTASNMGAWCFFVMHVIHCSCMFALNLVCISIVRAGTVKDYLLIINLVQIWQGRQRCRMEMPLDLTWARERILKIIETLGSKAKLSIFCEFYFSRYCVAPSSHFKTTSGSRDLGM